ncbi:MAG: putative DNA repair protein UVH3 [Streblomastix strix]|uniref:Putative DNA repair protein UVH3 n=1 Tax=Streblomastix strix TaxID=222440 RepID=A0A5J4VXG0_9EUKA|nr:MAG: putative DNA repair protein UVH3 [Streblomastix strix]
MGIKGLWKLLDFIRKPVNLRGLAGRRLAVDSSIWLVAFQRGFRDANGIASEHAYLIGLYRRVMRLLALRIRPVFVFDGPTLPLKLRTLRERAAKRKLARERQEEAEYQILLESLKQRILQFVFILYAQIFDSIIFY